MRRTALAAGALALALLAPAALRAEKPPRPETAVCPVCRAVEGKAEPKKVEAESRYKGEAYYLCSKKCKATFDANPAAYVPAALPRPAPAFRATKLAGGEASLADWRGKVVLVDFWATWCLPCIKAMPEVQALHERFAGKGFTVVGISIDEGKKATEKVREFVATKGLTYPILVDNGKQPAWTAFNVGAVPMMFLIDAGGQVVAQWSGQIDIREVEAAVAKQLGGGARTAAR